MTLQSAPLRLVVMASGWISLVLGFIGIFLPLLPTTPFVLLAAYCFFIGYSINRVWAR